MKYKQLWKEINNKNIREHYFGIPRNVRNYGMFIKNKLGTYKYPTASKDLVDNIGVVYESNIKIYQPVNNIMFFHDKFKDMYIFFDVTHHHDPKALLAIKGYQMEDIDDFDKFLRTIKRNKLLI